MKRIVMLLAALAAAFVLEAKGGKTDFASVRALADQGAPRVTDVLTNYVFAKDVTVLRETQVKENLYIEGYVVGSPAQFPRSENLEIAWQLGSKSASPKNNARTLYLESTDGHYGFRLFFDNAVDAKNAGSLYGLLELNLKGATLVKEYDYYVVTGLTADHVIGFERGTKADLPVKKKNIRDLSPEDIFTWVELEACELVFKGGAWMNVRETYLPKSKTGRYTGNNWMNSWCRLVCDREGNTVYLGLDAKLKDRRNGDGVPVGTGSVEGVLTHAYMPRYGVVREYILRPPSLEEVHFSREGISAWKTLARWDWNAPSEGMIPAEAGKGFMTTDCPGTLVRFQDCDNPSIDLPRENPDTRGLYGGVERGALGIRCPSSAWWDWESGKAHGLMVAFSTEGLEGRSLAFAWTFSAGEYNQPSSWGYPAHWHLLYSTDGNSFTPLPGSEASLQSLPYTSGEVKRKSYETSAEAGIGYTEHWVLLPPELMGRKNVIVKLAPRERTLASMAYLRRDMLEATPEGEEQSYVNFGEIQVKYR